MHQENVAARIRLHPAPAIYTSHFTSCNTFAPQQLRQDLGNGADKDLKEEVTRLQLVGFKVSLP